MHELVDAGLLLQEYFESQNWQYCFIGGLALTCWGEPRLTQDIDLTLYTGFENEERIIDNILSHFQARIEDMHHFAIKNRVLLIRTPNGVPADIALGGLDFEKQMIENSRTCEFLPGKSLRICTAEDLIIQKAFAARPQDWIDIKGILTRQDKLDWDHILKHLGYLCQLKEAPEILVHLERMKKDLG